MLGKTSRPMARAWASEERACSTWTALTFDLATSHVTPEEQVEMQRVLARARD